MSEYVFAFIRSHAFEACRSLNMTRASKSRHGQEDVLKIQQDRDDLLKIQQEREMTYSKSSNTERALAS